MRQPTNTRNSIALNSHRQPLVGTGSADDTKTLAELLHRQLHPLVPEEREAFLMVKKDGMILEILIFKNKR
jgi:hypothetical protein